jgi:hypothetical protein
MSSATSDLDIHSLSIEDPEYHAKIDATLFQAVNNADISKILDLLQLGANPTSIQKKGRTGTIHALIIAVQSINGDGSNDKLVATLLKSKTVCALS